MSEDPISMVNVEQDFNCVPDEKDSRKQLFILLKFHVHKFWR